MLSLRERILESTPPEVEAGLSWFMKGACLGLASQDLSTPTRLYALYHSGASCASRGGLRSRNKTVVEIGD